MLGRRERGEFHNSGWAEGPINSPKPLKDDNFVTGNNLVDTQSNLFRGQYSEVSWKVNFKVYEVILRLSKMPVNNQNVPQM
jgi:hypothetical protein